MSFDELDLLYLRYLVSERIGSLKRSLEKNLRYFGDSDDVVLRQRKIGNLEAELDSMERIRKQLNHEIACRELLPHSGEK